MARTPPPSAGESGAASSDVRQRILDTASGLFYQRGVRAVGVDLVVEASGVAKASLYRHFRTKDDLIVAFLEREDAEFWAQWDDVAARPGELAAQLGVLVNGAFVSASMLSPDEATRVLLAAARALLAASR